MWIVLASMAIFASSMLLLLFFLNHFTRSLSVPVEHLDRKAREVITSVRHTQFDTR